MAKMLGPIPGQSLTLEPGANDWEKPPQVSTPEEAFERYVDKFENPDARETLFTLLEENIPLTSFVKMVTRTAVARGVHSVDVSVIIRPLVHEYLKGLADNAGISYIESPEAVSAEKDLADKEKGQIARLIKKKMEEIDPEAAEELVTPEPAPAEGETPAEGDAMGAPPSPDKGMGLMSRKGPM